MQTLSCRSCGAALSADDLDRRLAIITCRNCGSIFDLARRKDRESPAAALVAEPPPERAPAAMPERFEVSDQSGKGGRRLTVTWRWFKPALLFLIPFAIAWDSFLVFWYATAFGLAGPMEAEAGAGLLMIIFPVGHVAAGVVVTYLAITNVVNRTRLRVTPSELTVRHFPIPGWPNPTVPVAQVEQLFVTRKVSRNKNGSTVTYELRAVTREHASLKLVGGLEELEQALWLEQEIERVLDLRDRPVAGEHRERGVQA